MGLQVHMMTVLACLQRAALSLGILQKIKGHTMARAEVFCAHHFVEQEEVRGPRGLLFTAVVLMDKPTTRASHFSKSRRETGSGTMGLLMQHR